MSKYFYILVITLLLSSCQNISKKMNSEDKFDSVIKIEMNLSAFGVESDNFPNIDGEIDFINKKSEFKKSYYNPANKESTYSLTKKEIETIFDLIQKSDLSKLKNKYSVEETDQPSSTIIIYTKENKYEVDDYGCEGNSLLVKIYDIAYKI